MVLGIIVTVAGGGVPYIVFQDIAPNVAVENHQRPPLFAAAGVLTRFAGHLLVG